MRQLASTNLSPGLHKMLDGKFIISFFLLMAVLSRSCQSDCSVCCCCFLRSRKTNREATGTLCSVDSSFSLIMHLSVWVKPHGWKREGGTSSRKTKGWKAWHCTIVAGKKKIATKKWKECEIVPVSTKSLVALLKHSSAIIRSGTLEQNVSAQVGLLCLHSWLFLYQLMNLTLI